MSDSVSPRWTPVAPPASPSTSSTGLPGVSAIAELHPAYFAMAMATGIVSVACHLLGWGWVASALFVLNVAVYVGLWILTLGRLWLYPNRIASDLMSHGRSVGFFTIVAATSVLGSQCLLVGGMWRVATALWIASIGLWATITYGVLTLLTVKPVKPSLAEGMNGGWLVAVVAAQSVCVLGASLASRFDVYQQQALFFCLAMWLGGGMLYIWIISLIFYRYTFFGLSPSDLAPPYWINMGAVAISTLAGALLVAAAPASPLLTDLLPFLKGLTLLFWSTATWWIPMLLILGLWRHGYQRFPLRYDPLYWGAVFPLGMYTVATFHLARVLDTPFLLVIPRVFLYVAFAAWGLVMAGLLQQLLRSFAARNSGRQRRS